MVGFTAEALRTINSYHWPGNVRELINRVRRGVIMSEGKLVGSGDMGFEAAELEPPAVTLEAARASFERDIVETSLRANSNNVSRTARQLGISRHPLPGHEQAAHRVVGFPGLPRLPEAAGTQGKIIGAIRRAIPELRAGFSAVLWEIAVRWSLAASGIARVAVSPRRGSRDRRASPAST